MQNFPVEKFKKVKTPFYYYDVELLKSTAKFVIAEAAKYDFQVHYALKANSNH